MKIPMTRFGVQVVPRAAWPYPRVAESAAPDVRGCPSVLKTTQTHVHRALVERRAREILAGEKPWVSVVTRNDAVWIFDGHHTLAAYLQLGRIAPCAFYPSGNVTLEPPRLEPAPRGGFGHLAEHFGWGRKR